MRPTLRSLLVLGLALAGCGYHFVRARGADRPRVAIQTLTNDSYEPGIDLLVTDALQREFRRRGSVRMVDDRASADLVIGGAVQPLIVNRRTLSSVDLVLEYEVTLRLQLAVRTLDGTHVPVDSSSLLETEIYTASADVETSRKNREEALRRVAGVIAVRVHDLLVPGAIP